MGNFLTAFRDLITFGHKDRRILLLGLDAAGKTTLLYQLKLGETVHTIPTIGFNVETIQYKNISFTMWDIGGQEKIRPLWRHYYNSVSAIIYVIDSNDRNRIEEAAEELSKLLLEEQLKQCVVLVLANKQDQLNALSVSEITSRLGLYERKFPWYVQSAVATRGQGIYEGLDWLAKRLNEQTS